MNTSFLNIIERIIAEQGETVLIDPARLKAFFSDLAKDEPKSLRIAFGRCIEAGAYTALKTAADASERTERKALVVQKVHDEYGLDIGLCNEALDILEAAIQRKESATAELPPPEQPPKPPPPSQQQPQLSAWKKSKALTIDTAMDIFFIAIIAILIASVILQHITVPAGA